MEMNQRKIWVLVIFAICFAGQNGLVGQVVHTEQDQASVRKDSPEKDFQKQAKKHQLERILVTLRATGDSARDWKDSATACAVQAQVADLLWDFDAEIARPYLINAWGRARSVEDPKQERSRFRNQSLSTDARREVILVARKRAPDLAEKWLEQMAHDLDSDRSQQARGVFDDRTTRSTVLLQMALETVGENQEAAAGMAIESLGDGISFGFQAILLKLQEKDFNLAKRVFRAALARLQTAGMLDPNELLILYAYMYTPGRIMAANTGDDRSQTQIALGRNRPPVISAASLDPALALEFLQLGAQLLISAPLPANTENPVLTARSQLSAIGVLMGPLSQRLPELAVALKARVQQTGADAAFTNTSSSSSQPATLKPVPGENSTSFAERRVDILEAAADGERNKLGRDIAYAKAALATTIDSYSRGWGLAGKIDDETLRDNVRNWLTYRATLNFISENNLDRAYQLAGKMSDPAQRAASLVVGAQRLIKVKETIRATQWLHESRSLLRKADLDDQSVRVSFGIVSTLGRFDTSMAFDALIEAIRLMSKTNGVLRDEDRAPQLKRFSGFEMPPDFTHGTQGFSLKSAIAVFGPDQFEDVLDVVSRISQPEAKGLAIVGLCRVHLKMSLSEQPLR